MDEARNLTTETGRSDLAAWRQGSPPDAYEADPFFRGLVERWLGARAEAARPRLHSVAESAGATLDALVTESSRDENLPSIRRHDALGRATEEVVFHPTYHAVGEVFWASGVLSVLAEPGNQVLSGAIAYLLDQHGEAGHACPVACTAGAIRLIQRLGTADQRARHLPKLLESAYSRRLHAAQFVTEIQGGSDVALNACEAEPAGDRPGWYRIYGEKWFCSVADAGLFVVSARPRGAPAGTRGLGLFLIPRHVDGSPNGFSLRRLKLKLGTRSMATGEIEFEGALGEPIGPVSDGFRNLVGIVLDTSRVHNALAACGAMRRAFVEAHGFAAHRQAFDRRIRDFPAVQEILARMKLRTMAALATTFRVLAMTDRLDTSDPDRNLEAARRIDVMINKYWTALACTQTVRDGIEVLGGNGTLEDLSPLPRLYRDAIVIESWEGTHNTLCAQVHRDFAARELHRPWLENLRAELDDLRHPGVEEHAVRARGLLDDVERSVTRLLSSDPMTASACARYVIDRMCRAVEWVALASQRQWELENSAGGPTAEALELFGATLLEPESPEDRPELIPLRKRFCENL